MTNCQFFFRIKKSLVNFFSQELQIPRTRLSLFLSSLVVCADKHILYHSKDHKQFIVIRIAFFAEFVK